MREGLGEEDANRRIEATLWGRPRLGRAVVRLADDTVVRWSAGAGRSTEPERPLVGVQAPGASGVTSG